MATPRDLIALYQEEQSLHMIIKLMDFIQLKKLQDLVK